MDSVHFSSASDQWSTPKDFYDKLNSIFSFTLDPCSSDTNHKTERYFTPKDNGLAQSWDGERVFMNPPYGRGIGDWVEKASKAKALVVCLVPARTDTRWWHQHVAGGVLMFIFYLVVSSSGTVRTPLRSLAQFSFTGKQIYDIQAT